MTTFMCLLSANKSTFIDKHKGASIISLGCGPSLFQTDPRLLKRFITVGTNYSDRHCFSDYHCVLDDDVGINLKIGSPCVLSIYPQPGVHHVVKKSRVFDKYSEPNDLFYTGNLSGHFSIFMAYLLGAKTIYLVGHDGGRPEYDIRYEKFARDLDKYHPDVTIYNCSNISVYPYWEHRNIELL